MQLAVDFTARHAFETGFLEAVRAHHPAEALQQAHLLQGRRAAAFEAAPASTSGAGAFRNSSISKKEPAGSRQ